MVVPRLGSVTYKSFTPGPQSWKSSHAFELPGKKQLMMVANILGVM